ncbi:M15 family metallopeptidase [Conexibacter sp. SYSU D00693]|uniref:M15 family metallopeptidase n=1 Tax=Conexibacter sp. SYSU D00693 TaxID=2812560 RepID=UPI001F11AF1D|nr:M15 family metallopeptidase [Conexibacter sp. SYSU D00693]
MALLLTGLAAAVAALSHLQVPDAASSLTSGTPLEALREDGHDDAHGTAAGAVPDGTSAFDDHVPGVAKLDPELLGALRQAASAAQGEGVGLLVDSGWRSPAYQQRLLEEAVAKYGSAAEAGRWVATPATSAHVAGEAVDVGPPAAAAWLGQRGAAFGLCQVYRNEPWHFELRPGTADHGCPPLYADPTEDPRMQP